MGAVRKTGSCLGWRNKKRKVVRAAHDDAHGHDY